MVRIVRSKGADIPYSHKAEVVCPMMKDKKSIGIPVVAAVMTMAKTMKSHLLETM